MRYHVDEIEDQIIATLEADTTNFSGVTVDTLAGQISAQMFFDPELMQGAKRLLPFALVSYQGRRSEKALDRDSSGRTWIHTLTFRFFVGAKSLRKTEEAARNCYDMLAALWDDLTAKVPLTSPQQLTQYTALSGTALSAGAVLISPLYEAGSADEEVVINMPAIVIYRADFNLKIIA